MTKLAVDNEQRKKAKKKKESESIALFDLSDEELEVMLDDINKFKDFKPIMIALIKFARGAAIKLEE